MTDLKEFLRAAGNVKPSKRQLNWFDTEFYAFAHFSPNTYTNLEWGLGNESEAIFDPKKLDCDQWVEAIKSAGMKGLVLTAKHHDGFCLWPSKYTEHCVKNSPGKRDIVKEAAKACERGGIKFGVYLSPWDRNSKYYGTDEYNDYYRGQLTELLTGYGEMFHIWFDNACGEGKNGRKQVYDFDSYTELIRKYQPNATIFNDYGPDVRWCGNESGSARPAEWAVVPGELCYRGEIQTQPSPISGDLSFMYNQDQDIGALSNIIYSKGLVFAGSEIDMSIRPGWFWHENEDPHSLDRLFNTYLTSVGANCCFNLNVPPTREGLLDQRDVTRLKELGDKLRSTFGCDLADGRKLERLEYPSETQGIWELDLGESKAVNYVELMEDISLGQRIESFRLTAYNENGEQIGGPLCETCVGHKKICRFHCENAKKLRIFVTSARDEVHFRSVKVF